LVQFFVPFLQNKKILVTVEPGSGIEESQDPGSGVTILDLQNYILYTIDTGTYAINIQENDKSPSNVSNVGKTLNSIM
jgi:hypothetical protein